MQLSSRSYGLMMLVQLLVIVPLLPVLPFWMALMGLSSLLWYWQIHRGNIGLPSRSIIWLVGGLAVAGIAISYPSPLALEPMVALSSCAFIFKLLELHQRRDIWVLVFVAYFLIACQLLFKQDFTVLPLVAVQIMAVLLLQQSLFRRREPTVKLVKLSGLIVLQAIPMMLFLFVVFPRLGPLWTMPGASQQGVTGMSDSMQPGQIGNLAKSGALAFRVAFEGEIPKQRDLYWRSLVLEDFDGLAWTRNLHFIGGSALLESKDINTRYTVTLQSGNHKWLPALAPANVEGNTSFHTDRNEWWLRRPVSGRYNYTVGSNVGAQINEPATAWATRRNLRIPDDGNTVARALAEQWADQYKDVDDILAAVERYFREKPFRYTLSPPVLGQNGIDEFLTETLAGFCEHYAGSFVYLMRAAGVPARVVVGYQGGERNRGQGYLMVHQSDAHAWTEVLHPERGWLRIDPVSFVAPERIELDSQDYFESDESFLASSGFGLRRFAFFNQVRLWLDNVDFVWAKWVLGYDQGSQWEVLSALLGKVNATRIILFFAALVLTPIAGILLYNYWRRPREQKSPLVVAYLNCCSRLEKFGLKLHPSETPSAFCDRVVDNRPNARLWIQQVTLAFESAAYRDPAKTNVALRRLKQLNFRAIEKPIDVGD